MENGEGVGRWGFKGRHGKRAILRVRMVAPSNPPQKFGRYKLLQRIATGGMAEIFLAKQSGPGRFERSLVIKRILPHLAQDPTFVSMFLDEAALAAQLVHPCIAQVYDFGDEEGAYFIAMELVRGPDLRSVIAAARKTGTVIPRPVAVRLASQVLSALDYAHHAVDENGQPLQLVHRDVSPQNMLVSFDGIVKLVDFGVAKAANASQQTEAGVVKGKYSYLAPEQLEHAKLDGRCDLYAAALVLYELLTLKKAIQGDGPAAIAAAMTARFTPITELCPDLPPHLAQTITKALQRNRDDRFMTCREFQAALDSQLLAWNTTVPTQEVADYLAKLQDDLAQPLSVFGTASFRVHLNPPPNLEGSGPKRTSGLLPTATEKTGSGPKSVLEPAAPPAPEPAPTPAPNSHDTVIGMTPPEEPPPALSEKPVRKTSNARQPALEPDTLDEDPQRSQETVMGVVAIPKPAPEPEPELPEDVEPAPVTNPLADAHAEQDDIAAAMPSSGRNMGVVMGGALIAIIVLGGGAYALFGRPKLTVEQTIVAVNPAEKMPKPVEPAPTPPAPAPAPTPVAAAPAPAPTPEPARAPAPVAAAPAPTPDPAIAPDLKTPAPEPKAVTTHVPRASSHPEPEAAAPSDEALISVTCDPPVKVFVDRTVLGPTPLNNAQAPLGNHTLKLVNGDLGINKQIPMEFTAGKAKKLTFKLSKGKVRFVVTPWADVTVDGNRLGTTPLPETELYEGTHWVELNNDKLGKQKTLYVEVKPGETTVVKAGLGGE